MTKIVVAAVAVLSLGAGACSSGDDDIADQGSDVADDQAEQADDSSDVADDQAEPADDSPAGDDAAPAVEDAPDDADPATDRFPPDPPADGIYNVGDTYYDVDISATHLGLAQIPVGPDIFEGGACYTVLLQIDRYGDAIEFPEGFSASTTGLLADGTEAQNDQTGVGCDMTPLPGAGYERSIEIELSEVGESRQVYLGSIHVPDGAELTGVQLYGSGDTVFVAEQTLDLS